MFKPFVALTSPTIGFNFSRSCEVSVRFQGCRWPFLAGLWTRLCCRGVWGGVQDVKIGERLTAHRSRPPSPVKLSRRKPLNLPTSRWLPCRDTQRVCGFVCVCVCLPGFHKGSFLSFICTTHFIHLIAGENVPLNLWWNIWKWRSETCRISKSSFQF